MHSYARQDAAPKRRFGQSRPGTLGLRGVSAAGRLTGSHDLAGCVEVLRPEQEDAEVPHLVAEDDPWRARDTQHPWCHDLAEQLSGCAREFGSRPREKAGKVSWLHGSRPRHPALRARG